MDESIEAELEWLIDDDAGVSEIGNDEELEEKCKANEGTKPLGENPGTSAVDTDDDEDDGLTSAEREILERNTLLNDASDREGYDVKNKVVKANADLESISDVLSSRETKVMFKQNLVDVEAPPLDYNSDSSSSCDSEGEARAESLKLMDEKFDDEVSDKVSGENKEILVEKGGKFQLISETASDQETSLNSEDEGQVEDCPIIAQSKYASHEVQRGENKRPSSAPLSQTPSASQQIAASRPGSASRSSVIEYSHIKSPYAMSPEMKDLMRKRAAVRAAREEEQQAQEKAKREENRQNAEYAWKCWVQKKDQEMKEQKKFEEEKKQKEEKIDCKKEAEEAYQLWLSEKRKQKKKNRIEEQQRQLQLDEGWYRRDRKECDRAYNQWLRQKNCEAKVKRMTNRKPGQQARADVYHMKKLKRLLMSVQNSQRSMH